MTLHGTMPAPRSLDLLIAGRDREVGGLYSARRSSRGDWTVELLDPVADLAALCAHPSLPVVYGISGATGGELVAWSMASGRAARVRAVDGRFETACDVVVSPDGRLLIVTDFGPAEGDGALRVWQLDSEGVPLGGGVLVRMGRNGGAGGEDDSARSRPHQAVFVDGLVFVPDLGVDVIRRFAVEAAGLAELPAIAVPEGTGPRHLALLPDAISATRFAVSGELGETVLVGAIDDSAQQWAASPSTHRVGVARTRSERNFPGDIKADPATAHVYVTNRGHDTLAAVALQGTPVSIVKEIVLPVQWPQHLLVIDGELFVAGWDSSNVALAELREGVPEDFAVAFSCPGAAWIIRNPELRFVYANSSR